MEDEEKPRRLCKPCNPGLTDEDFEAANATAAGAARPGGAGGAGGSGAGGTGSPCPGGSSTGAGGSGTGAGGSGAGAVSKRGEKSDTDGKVVFNTNCDEEYENQDEPWRSVCTLMCKGCKYLYELYHDRYRWEVASRTAIFLLALKLANECYGFVLPLKRYKPFTDHY